jgi:hypothetical protein
MNSLFHENKKYKKSANKTKKGGNFLGSVGELVAPTGWESFASAAGLLAIDRADSMLRREKKKNTIKGGGHRSKEEKEKKTRFREIMGWRLIPSFNRRNNVQREFMAGETVNSSGQKIISYPNHDLIDYIIEQDKKHKYETPISIELFKQIKSNFNKIMNNKKKEKEELNKIQLAKNQEEMLKQDLIKQKELQRIERNLEILQVQFEQARLVAEQFAIEAREAQKRADDAMLVAKKAAQEIQSTQQKLSNMRKLSKNF